MLITANDEHAVSLSWQPFHRQSRFDKQQHDGGRELPQTVTFGELLVWMKDWFERWYAELSAETTAVQPTFERTREREERNTPRLPDIPRVRRE